MLNTTLNIQLFLQKAIAWILKCLSSGQISAMKQNSNRSQSNMRDKLNEDNASQFDQVRFHDVHWAFNLRCIESNLLLYCPSLYRVGQKKHPRITFRSISKERFTSASFPFGTSLLYVLWLLIQKIGQNGPCGDNFFHNSKFKFSLKIWNFLQRNCWGPRKLQRWKMKLEVQFSV